MKGDGPVIVAIFLTVAVLLVVVAWIITMDE